MRRLLVLWAVCCCTVSGDAATTVVVGAPVNRIAATFAGFGWEFGQMMGYREDMADPAYIACAANLAPSIVRVGGISADFYQYPPPRLDRSSASLGWWPTRASNFTAADLQTLLGFFKASGNTLMLTLSEFYGAWAPVSAITPRLFSSLDVACPLRPTGTRRAN